MKRIPQDGYLREWLVLGSFAGPPQELAALALIPEASVLPGLGKKVGRLSWQALKSADRVVNLLSMTPQWSHHAQCCGYAHLYLHSEEGGLATLSLGSDDGSVLWLNGQRVFAMSGMRGNQLDQDRIECRLLEGWNRLLIKVLQYDGAWSFALRLLDAAGKPLPGLAMSLEDPLKGRWPKSLLGAEPLSLLLQPPKGLGATGASLSVQLQNLGSKKITGGTLHVSAPKAPPLTLKIPPLEPLKSIELGFSIPLASWAQAFLEPLRLKASSGARALSREIQGRPRLGAAFCAAAAKTPLGFKPQEAAALKRLSVEIQTAEGGLGESPALAAALERLTTALLESRLASAKSALREAQAALNLAAKALQGQAVHLVGHAHIDMNWLWLWPETVQVCNDTFRSALAFMKEFPDFKFTQSQAACYEAMKLEEPELFEGIKAAVKRGQWNLAGGMWVEGDTNLASGEAIARSCLLAQNFFQKEFGIKPRVGWLPDNFGHTSQLPQILKLSGIDYFYHSRTGPEPQLYVWEGLDGSRVLAKTGQGYNDQVTADIRRQSAAVPEAGGRQMFVYGVGDHGGGPMRQDIELTHSFQGLKLFPELKFSTADEYFESVKAKAPSLHVHRGELGYIFEGCYTNIAKIKQGNRDLENALSAAESLAFAAWKQGLPWPSDTLTQAWKILAFNQFHDILPGSAVHASNDDSRASYAEGLRLANQVRLKSLRFVASKVALPEGPGIPILVFNPLGWERSDIAVAEVVVTGRFRNVELKDPAGKPVPVQVIRTKDFGADFHVWVRFKADKVPALGYQCYTLTMKAGVPEVQIAEWGFLSPEPPKLSGPEAPAFKRQGTKIKGLYYEAELDPKDGSLKSLRPIVKGKLGKNLFSKGGGNKLGILMEKPHPMSAWTLDPTASVAHALKSLAPLELQQEGPQSLTFRAQLGFGRSRFWLSTTFHADSPRIDCQLKADWLEVGSDKSDGAMLRALWHLAATPKSMACDVPYGVLERASGKEVPAQKWVDVEAGGGARLALFNRGKYGHSLEKNCLRLSLLRSSYDPDPFPDLGQHEIHWSLMAHAGSPQQAGLPRLGMQLNVPLECYQARPQKGTLASQGSFLDYKASDGFVMTGLKKAESGKGTVLRGYDASGKGCSLDFPKPVLQADLLEAPLGLPASRQVSVKPWGIVTLLLD